MARFAANLSMLFTERPLLERFAVAAAAGFAAVEVQLPYEVPAPAVRGELDRNRLTMLGLNTARGQPGEFGLAAVPGREAEFAELFRQALDYAVSIGATAVHCLAGIVPPEKRPAADATFVENLARAADVAAQKDVTLLIEPLNTRDRPDYFLHRIEHAADAIARIGRPNVKIQFDCYHVQIMQGDLINRIERHLPLIGHVQIAAVPSRAEPDEGEVNYPAICAALDDLGYAGWIAAEYQPRGRTEDGLAWLQAYSGKVAGSPSIDRSAKRGGQLPTRL
jgi:hydroxypyruvate isomerase